MIAPYMAVSLQTTVRHVAKRGRKDEAMEIIARSLKTAKTRLESDDFVIDEIGREELILELKKFGRALQERVGVTLNPVEIPEEASTD